MSIFSRLFNKNGNGDEKDPADEEASPDVKQEANSRKPPAPATAATDGKPGTMRPAAPPFDMTSTPAGAPSPPTEGAAPAVRPDGRPARPNVSSRTLPYVTPDVAAAVDARVQAARSKGAVTPVRQGNQDPAPPAARPRVPAPSPAGAPPMRSHASKDGPKSPLSPPEPPRHHHDVGKRKDAPPDLPKGASHARSRQPTGGAVAAAAPLPAEPVAADPTSDLLTLEFASSPRQRAAVPVPAAIVESAPSFDPSSSAVVPVTNVDTSGRTLGGARIEAPSEATDSDGMALLHDLDAAFGAMVGRRLTDRPIEAPAPHLTSVAEVRELFMALAANHMRQVRDFMIGLKWGEAPREAVVLCEAATQSLLRAAKEMELDDLCAGLEGYAKTLRQMTSAEETVSREALIASYAKLAEQLPDVFALEGEQVQREAIIVHSLLQQVPEVRKVTIDKIYAAGLTGLDVLFDARPDEIAATTGISESLAALIVEKFRRYREDAKKLADVRHESERKRLAELLTLLREVHGQYEVNASGWTEEAQTKKKELRQARNEVLLQIKVLLARLGEVGRLNELERLPFERKIDELEKFLRESKVQSAHALV